MTVHAETFHNNVDGQEYGVRYYSNVGLVADRELRTHFVEPESGLSIRPKRTMIGPTIGASADSNRIRPQQIQAATGVPEIDHWNMLLRKGQYSEFAFGQSGFGQHTLFVAGGAYSIPKAQGQAINQGVRSGIQSGATATVAERKLNTITHPQLRFSGPEKARQTTTTPYSKYTQVHPTMPGKAIQTTIYDGHGKAVGQVDWTAQHGPGPGHGHGLATPGSFKSGHHGNGTFYQPGQLPPAWGALPKGIEPITP